MPSTDPFSAFVERETFRHHVSNNSARMAFYSQEVSSSGWGDADIPDCVLFDSVFIERPTVSHGFSIDGDRLVADQYPRAQGFVREWKLDTNGFYRGAWVTLSVDGGDFVGGYDIVHSFLFTGTAIKAIREDLTADSDPVPNNQLEVTPGN